MADTDAASKPQQPPVGLSRWTPSLPTNLMSMLNPFTTDDPTKPAQSEGNNAQQPTKRLSILSSFLPSSTPDPEPASPEKDDASIMFDEPDIHSNSDDASRDGSIDESGRRRSKRSNKPKTSFSICHPAPSSSTRQKLHRRPRSLLQLHKLSSSERPRPAYEIIPSVNFHVRSTRAIKKLFGTKHSLCPNDLVVLRAEKYCANEVDEEQEARDIVCLLCKGRREDGSTSGRSKICLPGGREWEAYSTPIGGYEFFSTDEHGLGLTVRWVPKRNKDGSKLVDSSKRKFNFSTISPNSRQHPVIATLSKTRMDINDSYKMPNPAAATPLSTPKTTTAFLAEAVDDEPDDAERCLTDDRLRSIIVMTGLWVVFKEGWSPTFKPDDKDKDKDILLQRSPSLQHSPVRASTFAAPVTTPPGSPGGPRKISLDKRSNSMKSVRSSLLGNGNFLRKPNRNSTISVPEGDEEDEPSSPAPPDTATKRSNRARADSASTVLVHRAASNRTKTHHQATWRPDLLDAQREMAEPRSSSSDDKTTGQQPPPSPAAFVAAGVASFERDSPQRRESVARPILPPTTAESYTSDDDDDDDDDDDVESEIALPAPSTPTPRSATAVVGPTTSAAGAEVAGPEKRESSTTTATTSTSNSGTGGQKKNIDTLRKGKGTGGRSAGKKKGWRRILCGSGQDF